MPDGCLMKRTIIWHVNYDNMAPAIQADLVTIQRGQKNKRQTVYHFLNII